MDRGASSSVDGLTETRDRVSLEEQDQEKKAAQPGQKRRGTFVGDAWGRIGPPALLLLNTLCLEEQGSRAEQPADSLTG